MCRIRRAGPGLQSGEGGLTKCPQRKAAGYHFLYYLFNNLVTIMERLVEKMLIFPLATLLYLSNNLKEYFFFSWN